MGGTLIILTTSIYIALKVGTVGERLKIGETKDNRPSPAGTEGDDKYWKLGGLIYNNPEDPSVFVAKRIGIGYTINLGTTKGKIALVGFLVLILVMMIVPFLL